jgi:hypothetical protein
MSRAIALLPAVLLLVAACGGGTGPGGASAGATTTASGGPALSGEVSLPSSISDPVVADAANRLGVDPTEVTIVMARTETFPDGSLGCPDPGKMYTQALVEGYHVVVEANGVSLDYRGNERRQFRICENP